MRGLDPSRGLVVLVALTGCAQVAGLSDLRFDFCEGKRDQYDDPKRTYKVTTTCTDFDDGGYGGWLLEQAGPGEQAGTVGYDDTRSVSPPRSMRSTVTGVKARARLYDDMTNTDLAAKLELAMEVRLPPSIAADGYISLAEIVCCVKPTGAPCDGVYLRARDDGAGTRLAFVRGNWNAGQDLLVLPGAPPQGFQPVAIDVIWGDPGTAASVAVTIGDAPTTQVALPGLCYYPSTDPKVPPQRWAATANLGESVVRTTLSEPAQASYDNVFLTVKSKLPP